MAEKYVAYAEYKDSGVEWSETIPTHWKTASLSKLFMIKAGGDLQPTLFSETKTIEHQYPIYTNANDSKAVYGYTKKANFPSNTITVSGRGEVGFAVYRNHEFDAIIRLLVLIPFIKLDGRFFAYFINEVIDFNVQSSAIGQLSTLQISPYKVIIPPYEEQYLISDYLDYETAQIDTLIEKQQTLIQLLKEKRQAVISHAVTKGLNPDAPMKDSGVEWLGKVPEHWDVVKLKRLVSFSQGVQVDLGLQKHEEFDKSVKFLRIENYTQGSSDYRFINSTLSQGKLVNRDELVMVRYGASAGYVGRGLEGALANNLFKISPTTNTITNNFLSSFLKISYTYFQKEMSGSAMPALNFSMVEDLIITLPPIYEQKQIADYLDKMQGYFDYLTANAEQAIQLMQERRTALISAAVTGKIDVRGWVAPEGDALSLSAS